MPPNERGVTAEQWRAAAQALREHAMKFDALADAASHAICGVVCPNAGPNVAVIAAAIEVPCR
jgi:hypothetical protein